MIGLVFRPSVLFVALLFSAPVLYQGLTDDSITMATVLTHFLVAIPVAAVLLALVRLAMTSREPAPVKVRRKD